MPLYKNNHNRYSVSQQTLLAKSELTCFKEGCLARVPGLLPDLPYCSPHVLFLVLSSTPLSASVCGELGPRGDGWRREGLRCPVVDLHKSVFLGQRLVERSPNLKVKIAQSCLTLCDPMDCSLPGSSVRGILQARILEWVAVPSSRGILPTKGSNPGLPPCRQIR